MDQILDTIKSRSGEIDIATRWAVTIACIVLFPAHSGFYSGCSLDERFAYSFCHANLFHLTINLMVLWNIKGKFTFMLPFAISVLASFLPMHTTGVTMGLSGFLFAYFGMEWGKVRGRYALKIYKPLLLILITMLIPNVNGMLHLYTFVIGCVFSYLKSRLDLGL